MPDSYPCERCLRCGRLIIPDAPPDRFRLCDCPPLQEVPAEVVIKAWRDWGANVGSGWDKLTDEEVQTALGRNEDGR